MEGIEKGKEDDFAVQITETPVATARTEPEKVKIKPFGEQEYELPFTQKELEDIKKSTYTVNEKKVLEQLKELLYKNIESLTHDEIDKLVNEIDEKYIKKVLVDFKNLSDTKPEWDMVGRRNMVWKGLQQSDLAKKNYQHFLNKALAKYNTYEKSEMLAQKEQNRLAEEQKSIDETLDQILSNDESTAKQHLKNLSKEQLETFNKKYKERLAEMYKSKPNADKLFESSTTKIKTIFDKASLEKAKQEKLAKEEETKRKQALLPPQATAQQSSQQERQRTLSVGKPILRSKSATREEPKVEVKREREVPSLTQASGKPKESDVDYKELRRSLLEIYKEADFRDNIPARRIRELVKKIPLEGLIEDELNLPSKEEILDALEKKDYLTLKKYMEDFELLTGNRNYEGIAKQLKDVLDPFILNSAAKYNYAKLNIPSALDRAKKDFDQKLESNPDFKKAYETVLNKRQKQSEPDVSEQPSETPAQSEVRAREIPIDDQASDSEDSDEEYAENMRRAKRASLLDQEEALREESGKRGVIPESTFQTEQDYELDPEAFKEYASKFPGDVKPQKVSREKTVLPEQIPQTDKDGNPVDPAASIQTLVLKALYDQANFNMQNPPKQEAFFGEDESSILGTKLLEDYAKGGNPLAEQYHRQVNDVATSMVQDKLIKEAANILKSSTNEEERKKAINMLTDDGLIERAVQRITTNPSFQQYVINNLDDKTYESRAADLLNPNIAFETAAGKTLEEMPDLNPDFNFELTDEEKALHDANVKAFIDQATRNFERTELRRAKNKHSGRNVWNSGLASKERSEIWQDFNRHLADKQLQMLNEAKQMSFMKKKELHEQKAKQAALMLQKSRAWLDTNVAKNRNQIEMANALSGLQGINLERAGKYSSLQQIENAARQGDTNALAALSLANQEKAKKLAQIEHEKALEQLQKGSALGNVGGQYQGQLINQANMLKGLAEDENQKYFTRVESGQRAGDLMRAARLRKEQYDRNSELQNREYNNSQLRGLGSYASEVLGQPTQEPPQSFNPHAFPQYIPGMQPRVDRPLTDAIGAGMSIYGLANQINTANQAAELTNAQTNLAKAKAALVQNQIAQSPIPGVKP